MEVSVFLYSEISTIGSISFAPRVDFSVATFPNQLAIGDIDGDNKPDVIIPNQNLNSVSVFRNTSSVGVTVGDLDGDGKVDFIVSNIAGGTISAVSYTHLTLPTTPYV